MTLPRLHTKKLSILANKTLKHHANNPLTAPSHKQPLMTDNDSDNDMRDNDTNDDNGQLRQLVQTSPVSKTSKFAKARPVKGWSRIPTHYEMVTLNINLSTNKDIL